MQQHLLAPGLPFRLIVRRFAIIWIVVHLLHLLLAAVAHEVNHLLWVTDDCNWIWLLVSVCDCHLTVGRPFGSTPHKLGKWLKRHKGPGSGGP